MSLPPADDPSAALEVLQAQLRAAADPSLAAPYPRGLALDLALESAPLPEILAAYELSPQDMQAILKNPAFLTELQQYKQELQQDGYSFRMKAKAQAEAYLNMAWRMVHDENIPSAVRADLIKQTVRWAALDAPPPSAGAGASFNIPAQALADLKSLPDGDLEVRVMQILYKRGQLPASGDADLLPALEGEVSEH